MTKDGIEQTNLCRTPATKETSTFSGRLRASDKFLILAILLILLGMAAPFGARAQTSDVNHTAYDADKTLRSNARINPSTLAMELSIPIAPYPGRAGNSLPRSLDYSSKVWGAGPASHYSTTSGSKTQIFAAYAQRSVSGWNSGLGVPQIDEEVAAYTVGGQDWTYDAQLPLSSDYQIVYIKRFRIVMPDGTVHEVRADDAAHDYGTAYSPGGVTPSDLYSGTFLSTDGSRMRLEYTYSGGAWHNTLYMPDGSRFLDLPSWNSSITAGTTVYIDANGNRMSYTIASNGTAAWTDTMGRSLPDPLPMTSQSNLAPAADTYPFTYPTMAGGGATQSIQYVWQALSSQQSSLSYTSTIYCSGGTTTAIPSGAAHLFASGSDSQIRVCGLSSTFDPVVLTAVILPNGAKYKFKYNVFGEIEQIDYPTGGYERFQYGSIATVASTGKASYDQFNRGVTDRWISADGTSGSEVHWQYAVQKETTSTSTGPYHIMTYAPDGTFSEQLLKDQYNRTLTPFGFGDPTIGRAYETTVYVNSTRDTVLRRTLTKWTTTGPLTIGGLAGETSAKRDARPLKEISIQFEPGNSYALAAMSETVYDTSDTTGSTDPGYFSSLNAKQSKRYDYVVVSASTAASADVATAEGWFTSASPVVVTESDYLYDSNYKARNISGLATESRVKDAAGSVKAKKQFSYDESAYALSSTGTMPTSAANSWLDPLTELGSTIGAKRGLPTTVRSFYDIANSLYIDTHAFFDQFGNVRKTRDGNGNDTTSVYDAADAFAYPTSVTTAAPSLDSYGTYGSTTGFTIETAYDYNTGLVTTVTAINSPANQVTTMSYVDPSTSTPDPLLRIRKVTAPNGQQTITEYGGPDSSGVLQSGQRFVHTKTQIDAANWKEGYSWFDGLGRSIKAQSVDSHGDIFTETEYDDMGRTKRSTNPYKTGDTKLWTTPTYDSLGRVSQVTTPDQAVIYTAFGFSTSTPIGTTKTVTDQAGRKRKGIADSLGRMVRVIEDPDNLNLSTDYLFDTLGNLRKTTQGEQNRYFWHDALGRLLYAKQPEQDANSTFSGTSYTDAFTGNNQWSIKYQYDNNSNITSTTDARNISIAGTYDHLNRLVLRDYSDSTPDVTFYYDGSGLGAVPDYSKGKTTRVASSESESRYTSFDNMGRTRASEQRTPFASETAANATPRTFTYTYNLSGALLEETYPSGRVVKNTINSDGELAQVQSKKDSSSGFWTYAGSFTYNTNGSVDKMRLGNGHWETYQYNERQQVKQIGLGTTDSTQDLLKLEFGYDTYSTSGNHDNNGSMLTQKITVPTVGTNTGFVADQTYVYDSLNRIQSATETISSTQTWKQTFSYDRYGNRRFDTTGSNTTTLGTCTTAVCNPTISTANNRFTSTGYSYNANGDLTVDATGQRFGYDAENRQKEFFVSTNSGSNPDATYSYDGEAHRVKKISSTETTVFVYDAIGQLAAEYSTQTASTPQVSYLTTDHLGSPRIITDQNGSTIQRQDFTAFGEQAASSQRTTGLKYAGTSPNVRQDYTGYEKDTESGLEYAQARYYNSVHGRFTSVDPLTASASIKNPQTFNRYTYGLNSPYKFTDPLGLVAENTAAYTSSGAIAGGGIDGTDEYWNMSESEQVGDDFIRSVKSLASAKFSPQGTDRTINHGGGTFDVRNDASISDGLAKQRANAKPIRQNEPARLDEVDLIVGDTHELHDGTLIDAFGQIAEHYTGVVRPVAYVPLDQGGNIYKNTYLALQETFVVISGDKPLVTRVAPASSDGVFYDMQTVEPTVKPTVLRQEVTIAQFTGIAASKFYGSKAQVLFSNIRIEKDYGRRSIQINLDNVPQPKLRLY
jgi:RHS repeat-associated protein